MRLRESFDFAIRGVVANKMRSLLTMVGITIGVASVITLVAVGTGSSRAVDASIQRLGSNAMRVLPNAPGSGGRGGTLATQLRRLLGIRTPPVNASQPPKAMLTFEDTEALGYTALSSHVLAVPPDGASLRC